MNVRDAQAALIRLSYDLGPSGADGDYGGFTRAAVRAYQRTMGFPETGQLDQVTLNSLGAKGAPLAEPVWLAKARSFIGVREVSGSKHSPTIMGWIKALGPKLGIAVKDDETAWCGTFAAYCLAATLPEEKLPSIAVRASSFAKLGSALAKPALGAVLVFTRSGGGHVGFYVGEDTTAYHVLGGNQSNAVNVMRLAKDRLSAIRWPASAPPPVGGPVQVAAGGPLSRNEA